MKILIFVLLAMVTLHPVLARYCSTARDSCVNCDDDGSYCVQCEEGYQFISQWRNCYLCPSGKGKSYDAIPQTADGVCSVTCAAGCNFCGDTAQRCLGCAAAYFYSVSDRTCTKCPTGYGRRADTAPALTDTACSVKCDPGCLSCGTSSSTCYACAAGYKYNFPFNNCQICQPGKGRGADSEVQTQSTTCDVTCDDGCSLCGETSSECLACSDGYAYSISTKKCNRCPDGKWVQGKSTPLDRDYTCLDSCSSGCASCLESVSKCLRCKAGYSFTLATNTCTPCISGKGRAEDSTTPSANTSCDITCQAPCEFCTGDNTKCLGCKENYQLNLATNTCSACPIGTTRPKDTAILSADSTCEIVCAPGCSICSGSATNCLGCQEGFKLDFATKTCSACPANTGRAADTIEQTGNTNCDINCDSSCSLCGAQANKCLGCKDHNWLDITTNSCSECPKGTTRAADTAPQTADTTCNVKCAAGCTLCSGTATKCYGCAAGFYYTASTFTCASCSLNTGRAEDTVTRSTDSTCDVSCSGCLFCGATPTQCVGCPKGYRLAHLQKQCFLCSGGRGRAADTSAQPQDSVCNIECERGCETCEDTSTSCIRCDQSYYLNSVNVCTHCAPFTGKPRDTTQPTPSANNGATECSTCHASCYHCKGPSDTDCLGCAAGFYGDADTGKCLLCGGGAWNDAQKDYSKYPPATPPCYKGCHVSCESCFGSSANQCLNCARGFYWAGNGVCSPCPSGSGKAADTTLKTVAENSGSCDIPCHPACKVCFGPAANQCLSCRAGYAYLVEDTYTCDPCNFAPWGSSEDAWTVVYAWSGACDSKCHLGCKTCIQSGAGNCLSCEAGFYLLENKTCAHCPLHRGKDADADFVPAAIATADACNYDCHFTCKYCYGPFINQCYSCRAGYYGSVPGRCQACPAGTGKSVDADVMNFPIAIDDPEDYCTQNCHSSCQTCAGPAANECVLCSPGFYKTLSGTCELCRIGYGKPADDEPMEGTRTAGVEECYIKCHSDCVNCFGTSQNNCLNCAAGLFFSAYGSCTPCDLGKGKPYDPLPVPTQTTSTAACTSTCHVACLTCSGPTENDCLKCRKGYYRSGTTTCSLCALGTGKTDDSSVGLPSTDAGVTECNITCDNMCGVCESTLSSGCLSCKAGFYYSGSGLCAACATQKGKVADTITFATAQSSSICNINCDSSCESCIGTAANQCIRCKAGMYLKPDGTCAICSFGKGKLTDSVPTLPSTDSGQTQCSVTCDPKCFTCSSSVANGCLNCAATYWWAGSGICSKCSSPYTKNSDTTIVTAPSSSSACNIQCDSSCQVCQDTPSNCLFCNPGFYFSAPGTCTMCNRGYGKGADNMVVTVGTHDEYCTTKCHLSCDRCSGPAADQCLSCIGGYFLSSAGVCTKCPATKGSSVFTGTVFPTPNNSGMICVLSCDASCSSCYESNSATACTGCAASFFYSAAGTCTQCDLGSGRALDDTALDITFTSAEACTTCDVSCSSCKGANQNDCLLCAAGYYLSSTGICSICRIGYGKSADITTPTVSSNNGVTQCNIQCHETCRTCSGSAANQCVSCVAGYYWSGNGVCTQCADQTGKAIDLEGKRTPETQAACNQNCHEACSVCSGPYEYNCVKCAAGYFYKTTNTCEMCPLGKGKPVDTAFPTTGTNALCVVNCDPSCRTCSATGPDSCLNCIAGFYYSAQGKCSPCEAGKSKTQDLTIQKTAVASTTCSITCHSNCFKCTGTAQSDCLNCNDGLYLSGTGSCSFCPDTFGRSRGPLDGASYPDPSSSAGVAECTEKCHPTCKMCKDATATGCLGCANGHYYSAIGVCSLCPSGWGKGSDSVPRTIYVQTASACTIQCTEGCDTCSSDSSSNCMSCKAGYYRSENTQCSICPPTKGGPGSPYGGLKESASVGCPHTCHSSCKTCAGPLPSDCIKCSAGHYLSAPGVCTMCPFGWGKTADTLDPSASTTDGVTECAVRCDPTCRTCSDTTASTCVNCRAGHFWESGTCTSCPAQKGKPMDTFAQTVAQTDAACVANCHPSCQTCGGSTESDCASCAAGHWWSGLGGGKLGKCEACPKSRGKPADTDLFPVTKSSVDTCNIYCDLCTSRCLTCSDTASDCLSCIPGTYLAADNTCVDCPENCLSCTSDLKCNACEVDYELTSDSKSCLKCQVKNCAECKNDPFKCTKCADKFTLKSATECYYEPKVQPLALNLSYVSITENPQLTINLLENKVEFPFSSRESPNFVSVTVQDKLDSKIYTCAQLGCTYSVVNEKLKFDFSSDITITQGRLRIDRGASSKKSAVADGSSHKQVRLLQTTTPKADYFIVVDGVSLMKKSRLTTAAYATRILVGILRLPLSLLVFWKYPHSAMLMDQMVTHLKLYSLMNQSFMAYVEVIFQSVSDSKILPFNFANPFEHWNSNTLDCEGFLGIRSKNMYCSFFDNYGENIIGLASVLLTCLILIWLSYKVGKGCNSTSSATTIWKIISRSYGSRYLLAKLDANHIEIVLMTLVASATADHTSKSVVGIVVGTFFILSFGLVAHSVALYVERILASSPKKVEERGKKYSTPKAPAATAEASAPTGETAAVSVFDSAAELFAAGQSSLPIRRLSVYFFATRYVRALLLAVFVTTVRDPVEQVVLVVVLEAVYLAALILFDFRGSKLERLFHTSMHGLMLLHLIVRAVATSKSLSDADVQSSLAPAIVVMLMVYIFSHVVVALLILAGIFRKNIEPQVDSSSANRGSSKIEMMEEADNLEQRKLPEKGDAAGNFSMEAPISFRELEIPEEFTPSARSRADKDRSIKRLEEEPSNPPLE